MKKLVTILAGLGAVLFMPELLAADESLTDRVTAWTASLGAFGTFFRLVVGFTGAIFAFGGILGLKKYADDSRQNPLMKPVIMFVAGALALGFVGLTGAISQEVTGKDADDAVLD